MSFKLSGKVGNNKSENTLITAIINNNELIIIQI